MVIVCRRSCVWRGIGIEFWGAWLIISLLWSGYVVVGCFGVLVLGMSGGADWGRTGERLERSEWGRGEAAREGEGGRREDQNRDRSSWSCLGKIVGCILGVKVEMCISNTLRTYLLTSVLVPWCED